MTAFFRARFWILIDLHFLKQTGCSPQPRRSFLRDGHVTWNTTKNCRLITEDRLVSIPCCPTSHRRGIKPRSIFSLLFNLTEFELNFSLKLYFLSARMERLLSNSVVCCKEKSKHPHGIFLPVVTSCEDRTHKVNEMWQRLVQRTHLLHWNSEKNAICVTVIFWS